ncbi:MAG TPA: protein kinase [Candidatus Paceibacterota bacterium]|nr:protein kinase [Candidatus Paceibacterota bacterium]HRZ53829.1 protein kinase [Candidatus Paceibacterota bacterium]
MNAKKICPCCGKPLLPNAPEGLCPACLIGSGLAGVPDARETQAATSSTPRFRAFGDYELIEEIARGGMGVVHKARQISLNRTVALKLILGGQLAGRDQVQRFRAEAQAAANLQHPNIVAIHEVGEHAGQLYFSMDYIEGRNLAGVISDLKFEISNYTRSVGWMKTVAEAVHYAHQHGILHRDLKPANIIIDQNDQPHVTDFGLAKRLVVPPSGGQVSIPPGADPTSRAEPAEAGTANGTDRDRPACRSLRLWLSARSKVGAGRSPVAAAAVPPDGPVSPAASATPDALRAATSRGPAEQSDGARCSTPDSPPSTHHSELTLSGQVLGSPSYLSPEQAEGKRGTVGVASDVYSLGAVLYHLLTGRPPFQGETLTALLRQVVENDPVAPRLLNPSIPRDLETITLKCLAKDQHRRYARAQDLSDELGRFLANEPIRARRVSRVERSWRWCRRNPKLAGALGFAVLTLVVGVAGIAWQWRRAQAGELLALQRAYVSDMDLATRALAEDDIGRVRELLDRYQPTPGHASRITDHATLSTRNPQLATDLRGWEWAYLWQKSRSQADSRLCTRPKKVSGLAFTGDGQRLVVHEEHGVTLVYDLATRLPVPGLVQTNRSWRMGFCPTNDRVAFQLSPELGASGEVRIWDLRSNAIAAQFDYEKDDFASFASSPDGRWLAGAGYFVGAAVWYVATGERIMSIPAEATAGNPWTGAVAFDPTGQFLAVGHRGNGVVRLHQVPGGWIEAEWKLPADIVLALAFSPDGRWLAASALTTNPVVRVWPLPAGEPVELSGQRLTPFALAFDPRSEVLATGDGQMIRLWDLPGGGLRAKLIGHRSSVTALAFSPDGHWLASGSSASGSDESEVLLWDLARTKHPAQPDYQVLSNVGLVAFEHEARSFLALADGVVTRFDVDTLHPIEPLPEYGTNNVTWAVSWDGQWLAHAGTNGMVHLWERGAPRERTAFCPYPGDYPEPGTMRLLAQGRLLAARPNNTFTELLHIWDTVSGQQPEPWRSLNAVQRGGCITADASRDGRFLATGHRDGRVFLWEAVTGDQLAPFDAHRGKVMEVAFSPDGRWLASAGWDGALKLWDVLKRSEAGSFGRNETPCYGITFSPDGRRVVNGGLLGSLSVVIWDVATRQHLTDLVGPGAYFYAPRFSPDGRTLAAWKCYGEDRMCFWRVRALEDIDAEDREKGEGKREEGGE